MLPEGSNFLATIFIGLNLTESNEDSIDFIWFEGDRKSLRFSTIFVIRSSGLYESKYWGLVDIYILLIKYNVID